MCQTFGFIPIISLIVTTSTRDRSSCSQLLYLVRAFADNVRAGEILGDHSVQAPKFQVQRADALWGKRLACGSTAGRLTYWGWNPSLLSFLLEYFPFRDIGELSTVSAMIFSARMFLFLVFRLSPGSSGKWVLNEQSGSLLEACSWLETLGQLGPRSEPSACSGLCCSAEGIGSFICVHLDG